MLITLAMAMPFISFLKNEVSAQMPREEVDEKYKWDLTDIYPSDEAWNQAKDKLVVELNKIDSYKGHITGSAANLLDFLKYNTEVSKTSARLRIYASLNSDLDTRVMKYQGMKQELQQIGAEIAARSAFVRPEILAVDWLVIETYMEQEPELKSYEKLLRDLYRLKDHTPNEDEGRILGLSGMVTGTAGSIYGTFKNAEMPNPEVTLSDGTKVTLDSPGFARNRAVTNRDDRELIFDAFFNNFGKFKASYGEMLYGNVKKDVYYARANNYESALEAALYPNNIPVEVYHALVENVNKNLPAFYRYLNIKKRMLGVDTLKYSDLYVNVVKDVDLKYDYDEGMKIILESLAPLGEEYVSTVKKAYNNRWLDVYPSTGKRSGAYSDDDFYDGHPFILLNYNGQYDDVSTVAHELGHTMHSYFSIKNQPWQTSRYTTFVAEVASTFNEELLFNHVMEGIKDDQVRLSLLMNRLDGFKGTLFRQTQFAEYELRIHEAVEKGIPLTGDYLSNLYMEIVKKYYGHDQGICFVNDCINMEWAYIPHLYYNFYVYQYSTSFTASVSLARSVMEGEKGAKERYMKFLGSGGSDYPIELLKKAGVDMTGDEVFTKTIDAMNDVMDQIEEILDKQK